MPSSYLDAVSPVQHDELFLALPDLLEGVLDRVLVEHTGHLEQGHERREGAQGYVLLADLGVDDLQGMGGDSGEKRGTCQIGKFRRNPRCKLLVITPHPL